MWTTDELCRLGEVAEKSKGNPALGVKQKPWWAFIPLTNWIVPILHCEIGVGNQLLDKLRDIINEYIEMFAPGKEAIRSSILVLKHLIASSAKDRDEWDSSVEGKKKKSLERSTKLHLNNARVDEQNETVCVEDAVAQQRLDTHKREIADLNRLQKFRQVSFVDKLYNARRTLADQQLKLKVMQSAKAKKHDSIETKMFKVLKEIWGRARFLPRGKFERQGHHKGNE
jgi:hypothetical protein